jgi:hypothetical protein
VRRLLHERTGVVFHVDHRLPEMIVCVLYRVKRLLVTAALLVLLLKGLHLESRFIALIIDAGKYQHVQYEETAADRYGDAECGRVRSIALESRRITRVSGARWTVTTQIANRETCGERERLHSSHSYIFHYIKLRLVGCADREGGTGEKLVPIDFYDYFSDYSAISQQ